MANFNNPWDPLNANTANNNNNPVNYMNSGPMNWQLISSQWRLGGSALSNVQNANSNTLSEIGQIVQIVAAIAAI
jgi:hypothetical protein